MAINLMEEYKAQQEHIQQLQADLKDMAEFADWSHTLFMEVMKQFSPLEFALPDKYEEALKKAQAITKGEG